MELSRTIATVAIVLGVVLAAGYASSQDNNAPMPMPKQTAQEKVAEREAQRREAMKLQQERKEEFARRCGKSVQTVAEQDYCREAYRKL
jgi:hypothetical protein